MASKTISLERSAYDLLKEEKRPGESFSDVVTRILGHKEPSFSDLVSSLSPKTREGVAEAMLKVRDQDIEDEQRRMTRWGERRGHHS